MGAAADSANGPVDLPEELQRELRDLEARAKSLSHYEVLGVDADADAAAVRRAYLERSRRFHPDAWYRRNVGEFGPLLTRAFQRMTLAYQVLSDEETRAEYDRSNAARMKAHERAAVERRQLSREEEERRLREGRERLLRTKGFARLGAARKLYGDAQQLATRGERAQAIAALKAARELDPNRKEIAAKLAALEAEGAKARAASALFTARAREEEGDIAAAVAGYGSALQLDSKNAEAAAGATRCALAQGNYKQASGFAAKAVELSPQDLALRVMLAKALLALSLRARARAELQLVLSKDPEHREARSLLRST